MLLCRELYDPFLYRFKTSEYVYYPNPRIIGCSFKPVLFKKNSSLKLLYYSQISKEKGLYDVIQIVDTLNEKTNVKFDMGHTAFCVVNSTSSLLLSST